MNDNLASNLDACEYSALLHELLRRPTNPKLGLVRMEQLLALIGFRKSVPIIQVVGTNGKGSTVAFTESLLTSHGKKTGLFISPHLHTMRERIRLNKVMITKADFINSAGFVLHKAQALSDSPSFFEIMLAIALDFFSKQQVDIIILEAGLGGRLDATTAVKPDILGISMIDLDHQNILGDSIDKIALEKINAAYPRQMVISVPQNPLVEQTLRDEAKKLEASLSWSEPCTLPLGLIGDHQQYNAGLAIALVEKLKLKVVPTQVLQGLKQVDWPGRFEIINKNDQKIILDGAHNPSGINALIKTLALDNNPSLVVVYGSLAGPNADEKIKLLKTLAPFIKALVVHSPNNPRALSEETLIAMSIEAGFAAKVLHTYRDWTTTLGYAKLKQATILVCGSLYTVGQVRREILAIEGDEKMPSF